MLHQDVVGHLVRRGLDAAGSSTEQEPQDPMKRLAGAISPGGAAVVVITALLFVFILTSIRYTLLGVVATLAQVEQPERSYVQLDDQAPKPSSDPASDQPPPYDPETVLMRQPAITSSIRQTLRHISAQAGFTARWRGLGCFLCILLGYQICYSILGNVLNFIMPSTLASLISGVAASIVLARWTLAWTHIVISEPSSRRWFRRVPSFATWRKIWAPTAINAVAQQLAIVFPMLVFYAFFNDQVTLANSSAIALAWKFITVLLLAMVIYIGIVIPSEVALTRCQASLLPDEDESIVSFDRSYGGKVVPAIVGGSGMLSYLDAWKSFDRASRVRIVKLYLKIFAIDIALHLLFGLVITLQLYVLLGDKGRKDVENGGDGKIEA